MRPLDRDSRLQLFSGDLAVFFEIDGRPHKHTPARYCDRLQRRIITLFFSETNHDAHRRTSQSSVFQPTSPESGRQRSASCSSSWTRR